MLLEHYEYEEEEVVVVKKIRKQNKREKTVLFCFVYIFFSFYSAHIGVREKAQSNNESRKKI